MNLILPIVVLALAMPSSKGPTPLENDFKYIEVPPLCYIPTVKTNIHVKGNFAIKKARYCSVSVFSVIYPSGKEIYRENSTSGIYDFNFEYSNVYTLDGMFLRFYESFSKRTIDIYPKFSCGPVFNINNEKEYFYNNITIYSKDNGISYVDEKYNFKNFESIYIPDYYHKLDLSNLSIKIGNDEIDTFRYTNAMFYIYDPNNLFEEFSQYKTGDYVTIPLDFLKNEDNSYSLITKNSIYVNPSTLSMSLAYKSGYVKTRHIYFPINQRRQEESFRFGLTISDLGCNLASVSYSFTVKTYKNLIGDCSTSKYCVGVSSSYERNS